MRTEIRKGVAYEVFESEEDRKMFCDYWSKARDFYGEASTLFRELGTEVNLRSANRLYHKKLKKAMEQVPFLFPLDKWQTLEAAAKEQHEDNKWKHGLT